MEDIILKANNLYEDGRLNEALKYYLQAEQFIELSEDTLIDIALIYDELKNYEQAKLYYHKVLDIDINNPIPYYGLGTIYDTLEKVDEAISFYKEAIRLNPNYYEAHFFLANIYDDLMNNELAIYHYTKTIDLEPDYFYAYLNLGSLYERLNQNQKALKLFNKAEQIDKNNHLLYFNYGVVYKKLNQVDEAIRCYNKSLELSDTHPYTFLNLAIIYKDDKHNLKKAIEIYTRGIQIHKNIAVLYYNRACVYALLNQIESSVADFKIACSINEILLDYMLEDDELKQLRKTALFKKTFMN